MTKEGALARKLIESLSEEQCRDILNHRAIKINIKHRDVVEQIFQASSCQSELQEDNSEISLCIKQVSELRWHAVTYLNSLEGLLIAWQYSVIEKSIIENEFKYLFDKKQGHTALKHFRHAAGAEDTYPAIEVFSAYIEDEQKNKLIKKSNVL